MGKKSKTKGASGERKTAIALSLWLTKGDDSKVFMRRPSSGGLGRDHSGDSGHAGDIFADKQEGLQLTNRVAFEIKSYAALQQELWKFLEGSGNSLITTFMLQAAGSVENYPGRGWAVVAYSNNTKPIMISNRLPKQIFPNVSEFTWNKDLIGMLGFGIFLDSNPQTYLDHLRKLEQ